MGIFFYLLRDGKRYVQGKRNGEGGIEGKRGGENERGGRYHEIFTDHGLRHPHL